MKLLAVRICEFVGTDTISGGLSCALSTYRTTHNEHWKRQIQFSFREPSDATVYAHMRVNNYLIKSRDV